MTKRRSYRARIVGSVDELNFVLSGTFRCPCCRFGTCHEYSQEWLLVNGKHVQVYYCLTCAHMTARMAKAPEKRLVKPKSRLSCGLASRRLSW